MTFLPPTIIALAVGVQVVDVIRGEAGENARLEAANLVPGAGKAGTYLPTYRLLTEGKAVVVPYYVPTYYWVRVVPR